MPDWNSFDATDEAIRLVEPAGGKRPGPAALSGGGSALFEKPLCGPEALADLTRQLLRCGADIVEMNTLRKRVSAVKGGRFAQLCAPARVFAIVLSDIVGDPLDMIASGTGLSGPLDRGAGTRGRGKIRAAAPAGGAAAARPGRCRAVWIMWKRGSPARCANCARRRQARAARWAMKRPC